MIFERQENAGAITTSIVGLRWHPARRWSHPASNLLCSVVSADCGSSKALEELRCKKTESDERNLEVGHLAQHDY